MKVILGVGRGMDCRDENWKIRRDYCSSFGEGGLVWWGGVEMERRVGIRGVF